MGPTALSWVLGLIQGPDGLTPMPSNSRIWLSAHRTCGAQIEKTLEEDLYSGHLFVFRGRRGFKLKACLADARRSPAILSRRVALQGVDRDFPWC